MTVQATKPMASLTRTGRWEGDCAGHLDTRRAVARVRIVRYGPYYLRVAGDPGAFTVVRGPGGSFRCVSAGRGVELRALGDHGVWLGARTRSSAAARLELIPMNVAVP